MTLQECYEKLGGNYGEVSSRLPSEKFIQKYVLKFVEDKTMGMLETSWQNGDFDEAFRASHTIKGMCQNLSFTRLEKSSSALTEALRGGRSPEADGLYDRVKEDYELTAGVIREYKAGL